MFALLVHARASTQVSLLMLMCALLLSAGCATALERESRCLASLTHEFIQAQDELRELKTAWVEAMYPPTEDSKGWARQDLFTMTRSTFNLDFQNGAALQEQAVGPHIGIVSARSQKAHGLLVQASQHHKATVEWYGRIYDRVRRRTEEERILSEARMILFPTGGILVYPIVRWNVRSVIWDGEDPDAQGDPIAEYCMERLAMTEGTSDTRYVPVQ